MEKSIGQAAYDAWWERTRQFSPYLAQWKGLPASAQQAWEEIALAAVEQQAGNDLAEAEKRLDTQMGESDG